MVFREIWRKHVKAFMTVAKIIQAGKNDPSSALTRDLSERERLIFSWIGLLTRSQGLGSRELLAELGKLTKAKRVRLFEIEHEKQFMTVKLEWCDGGTQPLSALFPQLFLSKTSKVWLRLTGGGVLGISEKVVCEDVSDEERKILSDQGIGELIWLPIVRENQLNSLVEIDEVSDFEWWMGKEGTVVMTMLAQVWARLVGCRQQGDLRNNRINSRYQAVFESVDRGMIVLSKNGEVEMVNQTLVSLLGKNRSFFEGKRFADLVSVLPDGAMNVVQRNLGMGKMGTSLPPFEVEIEVEGGKRVVEIGSIPLKENNMASGDLILVQDVSIRKSIESAVEESEKRLKMVLGSVREGITLSDKEGKFLIFNAEMEQITGYSAEEASRDENFYLTIHPEISDKTKLESDLSQMGEGERRSSEVVITTKGGIKRNVIVSTSVVMDGDKKMFLSAYHDVTEREKSEGELRARNLRLEQITAELNTTASELQQARDHLEEKVKEKTDELSRTLKEVENLAKFSSEDPFPVMRVAATGELLYANQASRALLSAWGVEENQKIPVKWMEVVANVFAQNNRQIVEVELLGQIISFAIVPIKSGGYVNLYGRDVTAVKEIEKVKNEFISLVSHQIRTPLTSIRWYSEMLLAKREQLSEAQIDIAKTIHETAVQLAELVNDLLNISRMESGRLKYEPSFGNIIELVNEVIKELAPQVSKKKINLEFVSNEIQEFVFDVDLVRQIYMNLLSNAVKYTPSGGKVFLKLKVDKSFLVSEVEDTGIGIPLAAQKDIFQKFYRAQNAVDLEIDGTGLGLAVAKMMVEKCGGKIWFESTEGKGTKFLFTLPVNLGT